MDQGRQFCVDYSWDSGGQMILNPVKRLGTPSRLLSVAALPVNCIRPPHSEVFPDCFLCSSLYCSGGISLTHA